MKMWAWAFPPTDRPWLIPWWLLDVHAGGMLAYPHGGKNFGSSFTLLLVLVGAWTLWNGDRSRRRLLSLVALVLAIGLLAAFLGKYPYGRTVRTMLYAAPGLILLAGVGAWGLLKLLPTRRAARVGAVAFVGVMALMILGLAIGDLFRRAKTPADAAARVAIGQLADEAEPGEVWILPHLWDVPELPPGEAQMRGSLTFAVSHFYALRDGPETLLYRPELDQLEPERPIRIIVSRWGETYKLAKEDAEPYVRHLTEMLGEPTFKIIHLGKDDDLLVWIWR